MKNTESKGVFWALCFLTLSIIFLLAVKKEFHFATDSGFLIKSGEYIYQNLKIPDRDFFSHTFNGHPWVLDRWAPCLFFFILYHFLGISGAILVKAGIVAAGFLVLMVMLLQEKRDPLIIFAALLLGALASQVRFDLRPQVISMLIFTIEIYLAEQYLRDRENRRTLVKLVALIVVWANLHSEWAYGVLYLVCIWITEIGEKIYYGIRGKTSFWKEVKKSFPLLSLLAASVLLSLITVQLINPSGYEVLLLPLKMAQNRFWDRIIYELMPIYIFPSANIFLFLYAGVLVLGLELGYKKVVPRDMVLLLIFGVMTVMHRRALYAFVLVTLPMQVRSWDYLLHSFLKKTAGKIREPYKSFFPFRRIFRLGLVLVMALTIKFGILNSPSGRFGLGFDDRFYPEKAFRYIQENNLSGNYFNDADAGGEMILFLSPQVRVFIDGRFFDLYDDRFYRESYAQILHGFPDWEGQLDMYQVDYVLVRSIYDFGLKSVIERSRRWKKIYDDGDTWIYGRSN